jgi:hypothetical protein
MFPHSLRPALGPTQGPVQWVSCMISREQSGRGVALATHPQPHLVPSRAVPLLLHRVFIACYRAKFAFLYFGQY